MAGDAVGKLIGTEAPLVILGESGLSRIEESSR